MYGAFAATNGTVPCNYAKEVPHNGCRQTLPFVIYTYKTGSATVPEEALTDGSRTNPANSSYSTNGTTGDTASQLQLEFKRGVVVEDKYFYTALLILPPNFIIVNIRGMIQ